MMPICAWLGRMVLVGEPAGGCQEQLQLVARVLTHVCIGINETTAVGAGAGTVTY